MLRSRKVEPVLSSGAWLNKNSWRIYILWTIFKLWIYWNTWRCPGNLKPLWGKNSNFEEEKKSQFGSIYRRIDRYRFVKKNFYLMFLIPLYTSVSPTPLLFASHNSIQKTPVFILIFRRMVYIVFTAKVASARAEIDKKYITITCKN